MKSLLTINLSTGTVNEGKSAWTPPTQTYGGSITIGMRFERDVDGQTIPVSLPVHSLIAAIGNIDARPTSGTWRLQIGEGVETEGNTTSELPFNVGPRELQNRINDLAGVVEEYGPCEVSFRDGSYILKFGAGAVDVALQGRSNRLHPISFGVVKSWQVDGQWFQELRLTQAPVAATSSSSRVLPPPPTITRVQAGGSDGDAFWNEIQALYVPPDFIGSFQFRRNWQRSALLSREDGVKQIAAALAKYGKSFEVTVPLQNTAHIEFTGDFEGTAQDLLEVIVVTAPEGDLTFTLKLDRPELHAMLRAQSEVTLPLSVKAMVTVSEGVLEETPLFTISIKIQRSLFFPELALVPHNDWLRPPSPKSYRPSHPSQVITGQQHHPFVIGDGETTTITVDHELETDAIASILVRENITGGRVLQAGVDYEVTIPNANSIELVFPEAPGVEAISGWITTAGPKSAFVEDILIEIAQVIGLDAALETLFGDVADLKAILPTTGPGATSTSDTAPFKITIRPTAEVLFYTGDLDLDDELGPQGLPVEAPMMLPAIHTTTTPTDLADLDGDAEDVEGTPKLFKFTGAEADDLSIGYPLPSPEVKPNDILGCDGRAFYPVTRDGASNSYFPTPFDRELFMFFVSERMLPVGSVLDLQFAVAMQTINANSRASWVLDIETGTAPQDTSPPPTAPNLQNVLWNTTPVIRERLIVGPLLTTHSFGLRIKRAVGGLSLDTMAYGVWAGNNDAAPSGPNFAVRARLRNFDTENSVTDATGWIFHQILGVEGSAPKATIK